MGLVASLVGAILLIVFGGGLILTVVFSIGYGITPTPTSRRVKEVIIASLPEVRFAEIVELGSGWGGVAVALARRFPTCTVRAYEISPIPYYVSKIIASLVSTPNLVIERRDFFQVTLTNASVVFCYLYPGAMGPLQQKFDKELSFSATVVSHTFAVPGWTPSQKVYANDLYHTPIYFYERISTN